jgi:pimeloyl-ACP methyl ester carboxylesterase
MAYLDRDGTRIYYQISGRHNENLPVLLSHGFGATSGMWTRNLGALAAGRRVITWDMRGHGRTECPAQPGRYTQAACVADMAALLDAAGATRAVIAGLSLGGFLSLAFWLAHPDRVAALMLFDTGPGFRSDDARQRWNERATALAGRLEREGLAALGPDGARHQSAPALALAARGMLAQQDARVIESLPSITVPVLVLVGSRDEAFLGAADYLAAKIPLPVKAVIPDAGHMSNLDQPDLFSQRVLEFLGALGAPAAG